MDFCRGDLLTARVHCQELDFSKRKASSQPGPRCSATLTLVGDILYLVGGGVLTTVRPGEDGVTSLQEPVVGQNDNHEDGGEGDDGSSSTFRHYDTVDVLDLTRVGEGWRRLDTQGGFPARRGHTTCLWEREEEEGEEEGGGGNNSSGRSKRKRRRSLVVFGGVGDDARLRGDVWELDLDSHRWSELQCTFPTSAHSAPVETRGHIAVVREGSNKMAVVGGGRTGYPSNLYFLELDLLSRLWRVVLPEPPHPSFIFRCSLQFCAHAFFRDPPRLVCYSSLGDEAVVVDVVNFTWRLLNLAIPERAPPAVDTPAAGQQQPWAARGLFCPACCPLGGNTSGLILVFGGSAKSGVDVNDLHILDVRSPENAAWRPVGHSGRLDVDMLPAPRNAASMVSYGSSALLFGGGRYGRVYFNDLHVLSFDVVARPPPLLSAPPPLRLLPTSPPPVRPPAASPPTAGATLPPTTSANEQACQEEDGDAVTLFFLQPRQDDMMGTSAQEEEEKVTIARVHRSELATFSPVMAAWLAGTFREGASPSVALPSTSLGIERGTWEAFFHGYACRPSEWTPRRRRVTGEEGDGEEEEDSSMVVDLLHLADVYELAHLRRVCERTLVMGGAVADEQVLDLLAVARAYSATALEDCCLHHLVRTWRTMLTTTRRWMCGGGEGGGAEALLRSLPGHERLPEEIKERVVEIIDRQAGLGLERKVQWIDGDSV